MNVRKNHTIQSRRSEMRRSLYISKVQSPPLTQSPSSGTTQFAPSEYETLPGLMRALRRRWLTVVSVASLLILFGVGACLSLTKKYSATATIEVDQEKQTATAGNDAPVVAENADALKSEVDTDVGILESPGLALSVIQKLGLVQKVPFQAAADPEEYGRMLEDAPRTRERMLKMFAKGLKVSSPEGARLINITYESRDPALSAVIANALAETFIDSTLERHHRAIANSSFWLQKELADLKVQVEASERSLADYERKTGMAGVQISGASTGEGTSNVSISPNNTVMERLFALNRELTAAEANRISTEMVYHLVQSQDPEVVLGLGTMNISTANGGGGGALTSDSGIDLVRSLRAQQASLARQYASTSVTYGVNSSRLTQLQQQIDAVKQQQQAELQRVQQRAENSYLYAKRNEDSIRQRFTEQQAAANVMADKTVKLQVLGQEAYSNRSLYESLFSKLQTASLASGVRASRIELVDTARPAGSPSSPDLPKYVALITFFGCFCGVTAGFLRESLDDTVRTPRHLSEAFDTVMLGYVPNDAGPRRREYGHDRSQLISDPYSPFSESFRAIRTSLLFSLPAWRTRSILITSPMGAEGKTTVVFNLGVALAQQGARVLLLDCDLRNPELHRRFGVAAGPGLSELLTTPDPRKAMVVVRHRTLQTLYLAPSGNQPELPAEIFGLPAFESFLRQCESHYDYVLIDSPPILPVADASVIATKVGGILAVVRSRATTRSTFLALMQSLERIPTPKLGVVLNDVHHPAMDELPAYSYLRVNKEGKIHGHG